jgi:purine-cytosine permease-like protein
MRLLMEEEQRRMDESEEQQQRADESEEEQLDRNMNELLQELRVSQTGVQILFAFLLALPFAQRFKEVTSFQRDVYFVTLLLAGLASALFIAPASFHRLLFHRQEKAYLVASSNWMAIAGLACLAVAITGVVLLIADFLFGATAAAVTGGCFGFVFGFLWYALPLSRLRRRRRKTRR